MENFQELKNYSRGTFFGCHVFNNITFPDYFSNKFIENHPNSINGQFEIILFGHYSEEKFNNGEFYNAILYDKIFYVPNTVTIEKFSEYMISCLFKWNIKYKENKINEDKVKQEIINYLDKVLMISPFSYNL